MSLPYFGEGHFWSIYRGAWRTICLDLRQKTKFASKQMGSTAIEFYETDINGKRLLTPEEAIERAAKRIAREVYPDDEKDDVRGLQ